jgi:hypothetical protein
MDAKAMKRGARTERRASFSQNAISEKISAAA